MVYQLDERHRVAEHGRHGRQAASLRPLARYEALRREMSTIYNGAYLIFCIPPPHV